MKTYTWLLTLCFIVAIGCSGQKSAAKTDHHDEKMEEKKAKEESLKQMEEEKKAKQKEEQMLKEEVEKKKNLSDKDRQEMKNVKERLKKMGLAAMYVPMKRDNEFFVYQDNTLMRIKGDVVSQGILNALNDILKKEKDRDNEAAHLMEVCSGGFETCFENHFYVYYMEKKEVNKVWTCESKWYEVDAECK
ncbi:hypothetical protein K1X84_07425 [bacterium]|nr:hypothetical protein [bacterium]